MASRDLLQSAIEAHGGMKRFERADTIELEVIASGAFFTLKGYKPHRKPTCYVSTKQLRVVFYNFGGKSDSPDLKWIWTPNRVWKERADGTLSKQGTSHLSHLLDMISGHSGMTSISYTLVDTP